VYVYCVADLGLDLSALEPIAIFQESEGTTVIVDEATAAHRGLAPLFRSAWITLTVHSDLHAVGLTAAVSSALADAGISCNMVAAVHHDHVFVPIESGREALRILKDLQRNAAKSR
jgi:hypothetical protein